MVNRFKKFSTSSLESALKSCKAANNQGYSEAEVYLKDLKKQSTGLQKSLQIISMD